MMRRLLPWIAPWIALGVAALLPLGLQAAGMDYWVSLASRVLVVAIAASGLNLVLGYGGMVSLGHAAFVGLGAYTGAVMLVEGVTSVWWHLAATVAIGALAAAAIGAISLRTRGVYFIMITLAFAQMLFYLANSIKGYGGDEGLTLRVRSALPFGLDFKHEATFYWIALAALAALLALTGRFVASRMGRALLALRDDETRAEALGLPTFAIRLLVFVASGIVCALAGLLSMNLQGYVSPNLMHWTQSGTLLVMVILGGVGTRYGGVAGAAVLVLLQEVLAAYTPYWEFWTGWVLLAVVLFARGGLAGAVAAAQGALQRREAAR